ncbi:MAG: efflux RND transporter periplasmic adaptor subunit [Clostridia bacterium]|jgi:RND family efflux transporter MFP subunit|nr:efflux RND transporter periplasmic adaptor subunit [Clostridia bacterium]
MEAAEKHGKQRQRLLRKTGAGFVLLSLLLASSCVGQNPEDAPAAKPVKVLEVRPETIHITLNYLGIVEARELKKVGFKMAGLLVHVPVSAGQEIKAGDVLAKLETKDLELAAEGARNTRDNVRKAYEFAQDNFDKVNRLYEAGAVSASDRDKAEVELVNLRAAYNNAEIDYQNKQNMLADTVLQADLSGWVADILYEEGEMVPTGYPVAVIRGSALEVTLGLSQDDLPKVKAGTPARVISGDKEITGAVIRIGQLPDAQTRTYPVIVAIEDTALPIGRTVDVLLEIGEEAGLFIPVNAVQNDGQDYVFVANDQGIAVKKVIERGRINNSLVLVKGLDAYDKVVIEGHKRLNDGDIVMVQE